MSLKRVPVFFALIVILLSCATVCFAYDQSQVDQTAFHMTDPLDPSHMIITSEYGPRWGKFHHGIDLGGDYGDPVFASASGDVNCYDWVGINGAGRCVTINHGGGLYTSYMHLSGFAVSSGTHVDQSQVIGFVGASGLNGEYSYDPHLHFQVMKDGEFDDGGGVLCLSMKK